MCAFRNIFGVNYCSPKPFENFMANLVRLLGENSEASISVIVRPFDFVSCRAFLVFFVAFVICALQKLRCWAKFYLNVLVK